MAAGSVLEVGGLSLRTPGRRALGLRGWYAFRPTAARIFDTTGSYEMAWIVCTIVGIISAALALMIRPKALHSEFTSENS